MNKSKSQLILKRMNLNEIRSKTNSYSKCSRNPNQIKDELIQ